MIAGHHGRTDGVSRLISATIVAVEHVLDLIDGFFKTLLSFAGGLVDLTFTTKLVIIRKRAGRFFHAAFDFISFT